MSYQQATTHNESSNSIRSASNMYTHPQSTRTGLDPQAAVGPKTENLGMNAIMNQFAGLGLNNSMPSSTNVPVGGQVPLTGHMFYTADGQLVYAPGPAMYQPPSVPQAVADNPYGSYAAALPYLAQAAYHGYVAGYPSTMPYTPGRAYYTDRADHLSKEVPGLENRRGSYSTNESAPGTPFYGALPQHQTTHIATIDRSPFGSTPSPQQFPLQHISVHAAKSLPYKKIPVDVDIEKLIKQHPTIPLAVPAVFTPRESMRTLDQSLHNPIPGNRNVYIRGLHPNTDDETLAAYAARFGRIETSKAIIDTTTGACKGFGFAKYFDVRHSELCIRGFYELGYEVGFARESFNARLKAEGDQLSTNLYVSNLPKSMTEAELGAIFMDYTVSSSRILRDNQNRSRGVGFARFETRDVCEDIIKKFHGQPIGEEGLLLQVRYADTSAQKDLKRITTERRQFRTNEYNVGAYGASPEYSTAVPEARSPVVTRGTALQDHCDTSLTSRARGSWKRESSGSASAFKDLDRLAIKISLASPPPKVKLERVSPNTPTISENGDDGVTIHCESPVVMRGGSPSIRKA